MSSNQSTNTESFFSDLFKKFSEEIKGIDKFQINKSNCFLEYFSQNGAKTEINSVLDNLKNDLSVYKDDLAALRCRVELALLAIEKSGLRNCQKSPIHKNLSTISQNIVDNINFAKDKKEDDKYRAALEKYSDEQAKEAEQIKIEGNYLLSNYKK